MQWDLLVVWPADVERLKGMFCLVEYTGLTEATETRSGLREEAVTLETRLLSSWVVEGSKKNCQFFLIVTEMVYTYSLQNTSILSLCSIYGVQRNSVFKTRTVKLQPCHVFQTDVTDGM